MFKRKDGRWQEKITVDGKRINVYGKTKTEVCYKISSLTEEKPKTFKGVAEEWQGEHRREIGTKTWINYAPHYCDIVCEHGDKLITDITAMDILADLQAHKYCSATIISTRRSIYRMILDYAVFHGYIKLNPAIGIKMPKGIAKTEREAPTDEQIKTIISNTDKPFGLFPFFLLCTGMRKAEALALEWGDIGEDYITVSKSLDYANHSNPVVKQPKTKAGTRLVPILDILKPHIKGKHKKDDLVFPAQITYKSKKENAHMTEKQYEQNWNKYCKSVGFWENNKPTITAHQLRHGLATIMFESDIDVKTAQKILGHASPTTTNQIYIHLREKKLNTNIEKLNNKFLGF